MIKCPEKSHWHNFQFASVLIFINIRTAKEFELPYAQEHAALALTEKTRFQITTRSVFTCCITSSVAVHGAQTLLAYFENF